MTDIGIVPASSIVKYDLCITWLQVHRQCGVDCTGVFVNVQRADRIAIDVIAGKPEEMSQVARWRAASTVRREGICTKFVDLRSIHNQCLI